MTIRSDVLILLAALLLPAGCADVRPADGSAAAEGQSGLDPAARLAKIEQDIAALRRDGDPTKPPIDRLEQIEGDIRTLVSQLEQAEAATAPVAEPAPAPSQSPAAAPSTSAPSTPPVAGVAAAAGGKFGVHLASYKLKESVAEGWSDYRKQYRGALNGLQPRVTTIDLHDGRGTLYRLKAGPFDSEAAARAACKKIAAYPAGYCKIMDFTGIPGEQFWRRGGS